MMRNDDAGQVLFAVQDALRGAAMPQPEIAVLAFQLLVWAELSKRGELVQCDLGEAIQLGSSGIVDALQGLAADGGVLGQAYGGAPRNARSAKDFIVQAAFAAKRFVDGGIFERFSPVEIVGDHLSAPYHSHAASTDLARLMCDLVVGPHSKSIYCPWEGSGQFIGALLQHPASIHAEGNGQEPVPALMSVLRKAPTHLETTDPLRNPTAIKGGHLEQFDTALSLPPMGQVIKDDIAGQDVYGRFPVRKATATGLMLQHIVASTKGRAAVVVPNSFVFGPGRDREVREHLLRAGVVEAAIALPAGVHHFTNILTALLILDTTRVATHVGFLDATDDHFRKQQPKGRVALNNTQDIQAFVHSLANPESVREMDLGETLAKVVPVDAVLNNEASLQVSRYVMEPEQRELQEKMSSLQTVTLDEVATFIQPVPNKDRNVDSPTAIEVFEIGAADLPEFGYIQNADKAIRIDPSLRRTGNMDDVFLRPFDLVLIIKGSVGKIGIVPGKVPPPGRHGWIAGQSAIVLRGKDPELDMRGLGLWLRSRMGQTQLEGIRSGAAIPMISVKTLRGLEVYAGVRALADAAADIIEKEQTIQHQIEILQDDQAALSDDFWAEVFDSLSQTD